MRAQRPRQPFGFNEQTTRRSMLCDGLQDPDTIGLPCLNFTLHKPNTNETNIQDTEARRRTRRAERHRNAEEDTRAFISPGSCTNFRFSLCLRVSMVQSISVD